MKLPAVTSAARLEKLVDEIGFLPFFRCGIAGFSLEECTPARLWFVDGVDGPWEWREQCAAAANIVYAKLLHGRACFVSRDWYARLANWRRDGYDFDARWEDGLATHRCKQIIDTLSSSGPLLSNELRAAVDFSKGFDTALTTLQMQTYIVPKCFEYKRDRNGVCYGWGVARWALSEQVYGELPRSGYDTEPRQSLLLIIDHVCALVGESSRQQVEKLMR